MNWTDQGIRNIKDSAKRLDAGRALAKDHGCVLESFFMTMGSFDNVAVVEAPDEKPDPESEEDAKALSEAFFSQLGPNSNFGSQFAQTVAVKCSDAHL